MSFIYFKVTKSTTKEQLNSQKRELSLLFHPDREGGSEEIMTSINQEYELALKLIEIRNKRYEQLCNIENQAMAGLSIIKPQIEHKLKNAAKDTLTNIVNSFVPEKYKNLLLKGVNKLSPIIDNADILKIAHNTFGLAKHILNPRHND